MLHRSIGGPPGVDSTAFRSRGACARCRTRVYLAISTLNEQGFEERGPLLTLTQQVLRETRSD